MALILGLIAPTLIILLPIALIIMVRYPFGAKINRKQFFYLLTLCFLIGLFTPYLATVTSIKGLSFNYESSDFRCYTGVVVFTFFGYMISLIGVPLIGIILLPKKKTNYS